MLSGRRLDLIDPAAVDIEIEDIAHGLSRVARWNGQTTGAYPFSVAQHSLLVEELTVQMNREMSPAWRLAALLHDAPEYVIGDMISPFKAALGMDYRAFEERLQRAIHIRFGLPPDIPPALKKRIKDADRAAAWLEATTLAGFTQEEALKIFGTKPALRTPNDLAPLPPEAGKDKFLHRFRQLSGA
ncbi:MAG: HD family hydrolase [Alphaproteobacteria bacterium]|nr:HD family hydrolase [Alphaproteobacteria bacterium]